MGGISSGRDSSDYADKKWTVDRSLRLDVRAVRRAGVLLPGRHVRWAWCDDPAVPYARIDLSASRLEKLGFGADPAVDDGSLVNRVLFSYLARRPPEAFREVSQRVKVEWTVCNYGGARPWWLCECGRRVAILYLSDEATWRCRRCENLTYLSQNEGTQDRLFGQACKIRERLGQGPRHILDPIPPRPKGMHHETYYQLFADLRDLQEQDCEWFDNWMDKMRRRCDPRE